MIKKDTAKGIVIGLAIATTITGTTAFAKNYNKQLNAVYNDIKIKIDGDAVIPTDTNGNRVEPFSVDGTTYLPVRAVAEALGKPVNWEKSNNTVAIGYREPTRVDNERVIPVAEFLKRTPVYTGNAQASHMNDFEVLQEWYSGKNRLKTTGSQFLLKGKYTRLTGKFAVPDFTYSDGTLKIWVDDRLVVDMVAKRGSKVQAIDIDLTGAETLKIDTWRHTTMENGSKFFNVELSLPN